MINNAQYEFSCGVEFETVVDIQQDIERAFNLDYQFIMAPISHPRFNRDFTMVTNNNSNNSSSQYSKQVAFTRSDILLQSNYWKSSIIGKTSIAIDLDSSDDTIRSNSVKTLKQEISWAAHLSLPSILLPTPMGNDCINYAQVVNQSLQSLSYMKLWIRIPLVSPKQQLLNKLDYSSSSAGTDESTPWEWWNKFRTLCNHHPSLSPALELTSDLPSKEQLQQWLGEPIKCVILPTSIFLTNKAGYPTLSRAHQQFLKQLFNYNIQLVVSGNSLESLKEYKTYLKFLHSNMDPMSEEEYFEMPYLDFLQAPLQPLMDNLESQTYEIFEKDPVKYREYQNAVKLALLDLNHLDDNSEPIIIIVVGAGRGPLVNCAIQASIQANKKVKVFAVEKNPNAIVTLRNRIIIEGWQDIVTVIDSDMRDWNTDYRADIMVSELLGSFGDNELSPECLDGSQKYLKKEGGISIPSWYTSYVAPISSSKLYNEVLSFGEPLLKYVETPYVVKPHNFHQLSESKALFTFSHPNREPLIDNSRFKTLEFNDIPLDSATIHGFIGYFDCCLYKDVHISINPKNFSTGMFSWFPIYFPLKQPVYCSSNSSNSNNNSNGESQKSTLSIKCSFWRNITKNKVWYEWCLLSPTVTPIQNVGGRSYYIGL